MPAESLVSARPTPRLRADQPRLDSRIEVVTAALVVVGLGVLFVLIGGASLELGEFEARLGLAAGEHTGPFGQVYGGWEPGLLPGQVVPSTLWGLWEGRILTQGVVRWPAAIAGLLLGLLAARRVGTHFGPRASVAFAFCWFGSLALIDRSSGAAHLFENLVAMLLRSPAPISRAPGMELDLLTGLATFGALDRIMNRGAGWVAGLWLGLAFLAGGWPPLAVFALASFVLGPRGGSFSPWLLVPPLLTIAGWSAWALSSAPAEAWAASLALPFTARPAWLLVPGVLTMGLPWTPFAGLAFSTGLREEWSTSGRSFVLGWLQVAGASLLVGTFVPGLAPAARIPALLGLAITAAVCLERMAARPVGAPVRRWFLGLSTTVAVAWCAIALLRSIPVVSEVSYYRALAIILIVWSLLTLLVTVGSCVRRDSLRGVVVLVAVSLALKLAHAGYFVPEWNYRFGQGAWGRAIGQWVPPRWRIYTEHTWSPELAFAIGRPIRQISGPRHLAYQPGPDPKFILLLESEYENWRAQAPTKLLVVARFQDQFGGTRILARTEGDASWRRLAAAAREE